MSVGPDGAAGVAEDRGGQALGDAHQAGPVHLHDQVVHLDPAGGQADRQTDRGSSFNAASPWLLGHSGGGAEQTFSKAFTFCTLLYTIILGSDATPLFN